MSDQPRKRGWRPPEKTVLEGVYGDGKSIITVSRRTKDMLRLIAEPGVKWDTFIRRLLEQAGYDVQALDEILDELYAKWRVAVRGGKQ